MTDQDRNVRTLIICFVIAIFALMPLAVIDTYQNGSLTEMTKAEVLGETTQKEEVVLPNAQLTQEQLNNDNQIVKQGLVR